MRLVRPRYTSRIPFPLLRRKPPLAPTHAENQGRNLRSQDSSAPYSYFYLAVLLTLSVRQTPLEDLVIGGLGDL